MQTTRWIGACLGLLAWSLTAQAQTPDTFSWGKYNLVTGKVDAWSGPNQEKNYATIELAANQQVEVKCKNGRPVVIEDVNPNHPGWVEIRPPHGSFSWIHERFLQATKDPKTKVVRGDTPVGIYLGSAVANEEPRVEKVQLAPGTQVIVLDPPAPSKQGGNYYPIQSPENEPRYIPANSINFSQQAVSAPPASVVVQANNQLHGGNTPQPGSFADLFAKADTAERQGKVAEAQTLYVQAKQKATDPQSQILCDNRLNNLQRGVATANGWTAPGGGPGRPVAGTTALYTTNGQNTAAQQASLNVLVPGQRQWTQWGVLKKTGIKSSDGQEIFRLEVNGQPYAYATAQPGYTLNSYAGQYLTLYGMVAASTDETLRLMRVTVQHVSLKK